MLKGSFLLKIFLFNLIIFNFMGCKFFSFKIIFGYFLAFKEIFIEKMFINISYYNVCFNVIFLIWLNFFLKFLLKVC